MRPINEHPDFEPKHPQDPGGWTAQLPVTSLLRPIPGLNPLPESPAMETDSDMPGKAPNMAFELGAASARGQVYATSMWMQGGHQQIISGVDLRRDPRKT